MRFARFAVAALSPFALALFIPACSDPVPPTPKGAWSLSFIDPGDACSIAGHNIQIGSVDATKKEKVLTDGETVDGSNAAIECSVIGTNSFKVDAKATLGGRGLQFIIDSISKSATEDAPVEGRLSYASEKTAVAYQTTADAPCQFYFTDGSNQGVAAGRIWVAFKCEKLSAAMSTCEIQQGYAIFENCLQAEIEEEE